MVASHDVGTSLQSLSASPDQRLCCVGGETSRSCAWSTRTTTGSSTVVVRRPWRPCRCGSGKRSACRSVTPIFSPLQPRISPHPGATAVRACSPRSLSAVPSLLPKPSKDRSRAAVAPPSPTYHHLSPAWPCRLLALLRECTAKVVADKASLAQPEETA